MRFSNTRAKNRDKAGYRSESSNSYQQKVMDGQYLPGKRIKVILFILYVSTNIPIYSTPTPLWASQVAQW